MVLDSYNDKGAWHRET